MNPVTFLIFVVCFASVALADDFKTIEGKEYKNAKVSRVEPDGIVLITNSGVSKVYFVELPKEIQERFHYDAAQAAEFTSQTRERIDLLLRQRAEEAQKRAEEREKYWSEHPTPEPQQRSTNATGLTQAQIDQLNLRDIHKNMNGEIISGIAADGAIVGVGQSRSLKEQLQLAQSGKIPASRPAIPAPRKPAPPDNGEIQRKIDQEEREADLERRHKIEQQRIYDTGERDEQRRYQENARESQREHAEFHRQVEESGREFDRKLQQSKNEFP